MVILDSNTTDTTQSMVNLYSADTRTVLDSIFKFNGFHETTGKLNDKMHDNSAAGVYSRASTLLTI